MSNVGARQRQQPVSGLPEPIPSPVPLTWIGVLWSGSAPTPGYLVAFRLGLLEHGYIEGANIAFQHRFGRGENVLRDMASELVAFAVNVIVASGTPATLAAKEETPTIPIVMVGSVDPVEAGLVASLERPGGNVTGLSAPSPELSGKRLQLLREVLPAVVRVAVLWNPGDPAKVLEWQELQVAAQALDVQLHSLKVQGHADFESAFAMMTREGDEALIVLGDPLTVSYRRRIVDLAARQQLPAVYDCREFVDEGGLMAYGVRFTDLWRRAAVFVDRILKGAWPGDLPIESPTSFDLVINLGAAQVLGLTIPASLLLLANDVMLPNSSPSP